MKSSNEEKEDRPQSLNGEQQSPLYSLDSLMDAIPFVSDKKARHYNEGVLQTVGQPTLCRTRSATSNVPRKCYATQKVTVSKKENRENADPTKNVLNRMVSKSRKNEKYNPSIMEECESTTVQSPPRGSKHSTETFSPTELSPPSNSEESCSSPPISIPSTDGVNLGRRGGDLTSVSTDLSALNFTPCPSTTAAAPPSMVCAEETISRLSFDERTTPTTAATAASAGGVTTGTEAEGDDVVDGAGTTVVRNVPTGTALLYPASCLDHQTGDHQENVKRLLTLCGPQGIFRTRPFRDLLWVEGITPTAPSDSTEGVVGGGLPRSAHIADVGRVHDVNYLDHLRTVCEEAASRERRRKQRGLGLGKEAYPASGRIDSDTMVSGGSFAAAMAAAGAVCAAVDRVAYGVCKNAFVAVRPPGHHAGSHGAVAAETFGQKPDMCSSGFCLINNVGVGAAYARHHYGRLPPPGLSSSFALPAPSPSTFAVGERARLARVAIVDLDIHHGNGMEDLVNNLTPHRKRKPLPPSWAPEYIKVHMPWLDDSDSDNVLLISIHAGSNNEDAPFYPCSGTRSTTTIGGVKGECEDQDEDDEGDLGYGRDLGGGRDSRTEGRERAHIINVPIQYVKDNSDKSAAERKRKAKAARGEYRAAVSDTVVPALDKFKPDIIFISAGFDGHCEDKYFYLTEEDFGWITEQLCGVAERHCGGRVVSVLEGGYEVNPPSIPPPPTRVLRRSGGGEKASRSSGGGATLSTTGGCGEHTVGNPAAPAVAATSPEDDESTWGVKYAGLPRSAAAHVLAMMKASRGITGQGGTDYLY